MKRLLRAVCLVLCWTLLMAGMPGKASAEEAAPMVRVLLRRLQLTDRADLTLAGAYTVRVGGEDLMALPENAQVTVQIRSGALYLFYDGMSMRLGKSAEFRRNQSSSAMPGLRFEKNGNLYPGSLMLTVENGTLVPILTLSVEDNGCGMTSEQLERVRDPFYTTRTTRPVGMGIPLFRMAAEATGGSLSITSKPGAGTTVTAVFGLSHIDRLPLGDMDGTVSTLVRMNPGLDFCYIHRVDGREFVFDTREIRDILGDVPLDDPDVALWLNEYLREQDGAVGGTA